MNGRWGGALRLVVVALGLALPVPAPDTRGSVQTEATPIATLADPAVTESSGLAASRQSPGVLWTINDSGDGPLLFATNRTGGALGRFAVVGAENVDWEDLAIAPGAHGRDALYIADVGDNARDRDDLALYRVDEPAVRTGVGSPAEPIPTAPAERFPFAYPDGHHDAETLLVHPTTGETLIVTKESAATHGVYRFPQPLAAGEPVVVEPVTTLTLPGEPAPLAAPTGGAVAPDGSGLAIRTYTAAFVWPVRPGQSMAEAFATTPARVDFPPAQGEAVAYRDDGAALLATSEGAPCPLFEAPLAPEAGPNAAARSPDEPG